MPDSPHRHEGRLLQHSLLLMVSAQVANVSNLLFHAVMGWNTPKEEYSILITMLSMLLILSTPMDALRTSMAHFAGRAMRLGRPGMVRALTVLWVTRTCCVALPLSVLLLVFSRPVASFFHLPSFAPVVVVALALPFVLVGPLLAGVLQGVQSFLWLALAMHGWGLVRLALGYGLVLAGFTTAVWGLTSHGVAIAFAVTVGAFGIWWTTRGASLDPETTHGVGAYFFRSLLLLGAYAVLMNSDMMLVRHYLPGEAGYFAWAGTIGRSVIFLPMPIALALFPKVISAGTTSRSSRRLLLKALAMVTALILASVSAVWLMPWLPLLLLYKVHNPAPEVVHLVRIVALAMAPLALTYLLLNFEVAQHRFATVPYMILLAALYIGGVALWHGTLGEVVTVLGCVSLLSAVVYVVALLRAQQAAPAPAT